jgi:hypothetical protein
LPVLPCKFLYRRRAGLVKTGMENHLGQTATSE